MEQPTLTMAEQVAQAASVFQQQRTGHAPSAVTVVLSEDTLVITLHGALSPAEAALAKSPAGGAAAGLSPAVVRQFVRAAATADQENHGCGGARSGRGSRTERGHRGAGVHQRHDGAGFRARPRPAGGCLEWVRAQRSADIESGDASVIALKEFAAASLAARQACL